MKVTITAKDGTTRTVEVKSGEDIQAKSGEKIQLSADADNPAVIILPSGTDLVVMLSDGTWITLVGANDPGVVGEDGGIEVSVEGVGTVISAENSFTSYQGILLGSNVVAGHGGEEGQGVGAPFYEPVSDLNNLFSQNLLPELVQQSLLDLFGRPGVDGLLIGDAFAFVAPLLAEVVEAVEDAPNESTVATAASGPGCVGAAFTGSPAGSSTLVGTACDDSLVAFRDDNTLTGLAGNDTLSVTDMVALVAEDPDIDAESSDNTLSGGDGNDIMSVSASAEASTSDAFGEGIAEVGAYDNSLIGGAGNDTMSVSVFADVYSEVNVDVEGFAEGFAEGYADNNTLIGGDGNDDMSVIAETGVSAKAYVSDFSDPGNDADADASATTYYTAAVANDNSLSGGGGDDIMSISADTEAFVNAFANAEGYADDEASAYAFGEGMAYAYANDNTLSGGDGNDVMSVSANVGSYVTAASKSYSEYSGAGDAESRAYSESDAYADANDNSLSGGVGDDAMTVTASAAAFSGGVAFAAAGGATVATTTAQANAEASADDNTLSGGDGDDLLVVRATSAAIGAAIANADTESADAEAYADARASDNSLEGGAGDDTLSVGAYSEATAYSDSDNADTYADSRANDNTLLGGDGDDVLTVTARAETSSDDYSRGGASADRNSLVGGAGDDTLTVYSYTSSADGGRGSSVTGNTLIGGAGADVITETAVGSSVTGTTIFGGDGGDRLSLTASGYDGPGGGGGQPRGGGGGEKGYSSSGLYGNAVYGDAGDDYISVYSDGTGQSIQGVLDANIIDGGDGEDTLKIFGGGNVGSAAGVSNIEVLDLQNGESNSISLSAADVAGMTDDDNILSIVGDAGVDVIDLTDWTLYSGPDADGLFTFVSSLDGGEQLQTNLSTGITPIVLDLNGDGLTFTQIGGNQFDVDGDGQLENISWAGAGDAVLAYDANGDGMISSLEEIAFASYVPGSTSDLEGLGAFDSNGDGIFSAEDDAFGSFFLWQEVNLDGVGSGLELVSLADAGIASINLDALNTDGYGVGHVFVQGTGEFTWEDGSTGQLGDAIFLSQEQQVDLDGVLEDGSGAAPEDEALVAAVDENTGGGGGSGAGDVPEIPEVPLPDGSDPLAPTDEEIAAV